MPHHLRHHHRIPDCYSYTSSSSSSSSPAANSISINNTITITASIIPLSHHAFPCAAAEAAGCSGAGCGAGCGGVGSWARKAATWVSIRQRWASCRPSDAKSSCRSCSPPMSSDRFVLHPFLAASIVWKWLPTHVNNAYIYIDIHTYNAIIRSMSRTAHSNMNNEMENLWKPISSMALVDLGSVFPRKSEGPHWNTPIYEPGGGGSWFSHVSTNTQTTTSTGKYNYFRVTYPRVSLLGVLVWG